MENNLALILYNCDIVDTELLLFPRMGIIFLMNMGRVEFNYVKIDNLSAVNRDSYVLFSVMNTMIKFNLCII